MATSIGDRYNIFSPNYVRPTDDEQEVFMLAERKRASFLTDRTPKDYTDTEMAEIIRNAMANYKEPPPVKPVKWGACRQFIYRYRLAFTYAWVRRIDRCKDFVTRCHKASRYVFFDKGHLYDEGDW